jgi:hypothetical protein
LITKYPKDKDGQISAEVLETQLELKNLIWLDSVFKIMESLPRVEEGKLEGETIERGYDLISSLLIDIIQLRIISH